jgi:hypothetical protein
VSGRDYHWSVRLAVGVGVLALAQFEALFAYLLLHLHNLLTTLFEVHVRFRPTPLPLSYAGGAVVVLLLFVGLTSVTLLLLVLVAVHAADDPWTVPSALEACADHRYDLDDMRVVVRRGAGVAGGFAVVVALLVWLPVQLPVEALTLVLLGAAGAGGAVYWSVRVPNVSEVGAGVALLAYPPLVMRAVQRLGPAESAVEATVTDPVSAAIAMVAVVPPLLVAGFVTLDLELDWRAGVPLAMALLLVGPAAVGLQPDVQQPPPGESSVDVSGTVNVSAHEKVVLGGSDNLVETFVVRVGSQRVHNPADRAQVVTVPDVRACLFTPERHDLDVRQGSYDGSFHYPLHSQLGMAPDGTRTATLRLDLGLPDARNEELDAATMDGLGTVPVTVADDCPEQSDRPRLVIYTTDGYDPRGAG